MTIKQDPETGTWFFVVDLPSTDGKRRQARRRGFATKKAAKDARDTILDDVRNGIHVDRNALTVGQFLKDTWMPTRSTQLRPSTVEAYSVAVNNWIIPKLGAVRLQHLDPATVAQFVGAMLAEGRSPKYVRNIHGVLRKALATPDGSAWSARTRQPTPNCRPCVVVSFGRGTPTSSAGSCATSRATDSGRSGGF